MKKEKCYGEMMSLSISCIINYQKNFLPGQSYSPIEYMCFFLSKTQCKAKGLSFCFGYQESPIER